MSPRRACAVSVSLLALLAGGCGTTTKDQADKFKGEAKDVAKVVDDLQDASSRRDSDKICDTLLAKALVDRISAASKQSCADAVKDSLKDVDSYKLEVQDNGIKITGTTATARVKTEVGKGDRLDTLQLVKEAQRRGGKTTQVWKVSSLAG